MKTFSDIFAMVFGGYTSEEELKELDTLDGEYVMESIIDDEEVLDEILQQAAMFRSMRN